MFGKKYLYPDYEHNDTNETNTIHSDDYLYRVFKGDTNLIDLLKYMSYDPERLVSSIKEVIKRDREISRSKIIDLNTIASLQDNNKKLAEEHSSISDKYNNLEDEYKKLYKSYNVLIDRLRTINDKDLDSFINKYSKNKYNKVLYFKDLDGIKFIRTFLEQLQLVLKQKYEIPCRLIIRDYDNDIRNKYGEYVKEDKVTIKDVLFNNILITKGRYDVVNKILCNESNQEILIVLDRIPDDNYLVIDDNVSFFYCVEDYRKVKDKLKSSQVICENYGKLKIPYFTEYEHSNSVVRNQMYLDMELMKHFINLVND